MTLVRYNVNGTIDTTFGIGRLRDRMQFAGTPVAALRATAARPR